MCTTNSPKDFSNASVEQAICDVMKSITTQNVAITNIFTFLCEILQKALHCNYSPKELECINNFINTLTKSLSQMRTVTLSELAHLERILEDYNFVDDEDEM